MLKLEKRSFADQLERPTANHAIRALDVWRSGYTKIEVIVVFAVLAFFLAVLLPALQRAREHARRLQCGGNLKQMILALHNYAQACKVFPPGTVCTSSPIQPSNQYDVLTEAAQTGAGPQGTGFLLRVLPFMEGDCIGNPWDWTVGICNVTKKNFQGRDNYQLATIDIKGFYCPSRRQALRPGDKVMMLSTAWTGGGTDYGGCAGRHAAFTPATGCNLCDATMYYEPSFFPKPLTGKSDDPPKKRWGIFGRVNVSTKFDEIRDGMSNTLMTGELQRITDLTPTSKDGWVIGGPATLFTTGAMFRRSGNRVVPALDGRLMNNGFFGSPGSDHAGGANFGLADGTVTWLNTEIDPNVFALLGSMADGQSVDPNQP